jgi:hypothetical protein
MCLFLYQFNVLRVFLAPFVIHTFGAFHLIILVFHTSQNLPVGGPPTDIYIVEKSNFVFFTVLST